MRCPYCQSLSDVVVDGRPADNGVTYRRRRACLKCERRWTTYERIVTPKQTVEHRDGSSEAFEARHVISQVMRHCAKLPVPFVAQAADVLVRQLSDAGRLLSTGYIAEAMMATLVKLHPIACLRFELEWRRPENAADMLQIVWDFADRNGLRVKQR